MAPPSVPPRLDVVDDDVVGVWTSASSVLHAVTPQTTAIPMADRPTNRLRERTFTRFSLRWCRCAMSRLVASTAVAVGGCVVVRAAAIRPPTLEADARGFRRTVAIPVVRRSEGHGGDGWVHCQNGSGIHCEKNQKPWPAGAGAGAGAGASGCGCAGTGFG
jgi:hypothetical protein